MGFGPVASNLSHPTVLPTPQCDVLTVARGQIPAGQFRSQLRIHTAACGQPCTLASTATAGFRVQVRRRAVRQMVDPL